ncbi:MAG: hypothetical protein EB100_01395 [Crocinitomicaceae bacterium]|nr:hypothetical protein [Crocinitomicaceae bacterium]
MNQIKKNRIDYFAYALLLLIIGSCSTENYSFVSKTYHATTTKYNGYFNANELLNNSLVTFRENYKENYYQILPTEVFPKKQDEIEGMLPSIDTAISKCTKVIKYHSMPTMDYASGKKEEFNSQMDENWLLLSKAFYTKHDLELASKNFQFTQRLFKKDKSNYLASIWMSKILIEKEEYQDAADRISQIEAVIEKQEKEDAEKPLLQKIPVIKYLIKNREKKSSEKNTPRIDKAVKFELGVTKAQLNIQTNDYKKGIESIEYALKNTRKRTIKARLYFILGQLNLKIANKPGAKEAFSKVLKYPANFELHFNAKIQRAFTGGDEKVKKELLALLKDEKNSDYRDQIYFALADISLQEKNKTEAIFHLTQSAFYSTTNKYQQALSYEKLAQIHLEKKAYVATQKYYDSCVSSMPELYPNSEAIRKKAMKLKNLVIAIETVNYEDSVLRIASLSPNDRTKEIEKYIKISKQQFEKKKRQEAAKMRLLQEQQQKAQAENSKGNWYWSNVKSRADGYSEFRKNWGTRENLDDWRRSERIILQQGVANNDTTSKENENIQTKNTLDTLSLDYLISKLPLTTAAKDTSIQRLLKAQYEAGMIYKEQLEEPVLAAERFNDILKRNLNPTYNLLASYQLYRLYDGKDSKKASEQKNYILTKFPNSDYANYLKDPDYLVKKKERAKGEVNDYLVVLEAYRAKEYSKVIQSCKTKSGNIVNLELIPKYKLLHVMALASNQEGKEKLIPLLNELIQQHPSTLEAKKAKDLLDAMNPSLDLELQKDSDTISKEIASENLNEPQKESPFKFDENAEIWVMVLLNPGMIASDAKIKISDFIASSYENSELVATSKLYSQEQSYIIIKKFNNSDSDEFIGRFQSDTDNLGEYSMLELLKITQENLKVLFEKHNIDEYKEFYSNHY